MPPPPPSSKGHIRGDATRLPGMTLTDFWFEVPLDHFKRSRDDSRMSKYANETIKVFVREIVSTGREHWRQPALLYLEGGPGFQAPRPLSRSGWLQRALEEYRVYLLDQRGCGLSTQITSESLLSLSPADQASFFCFFRSDSIVADCEIIRRELLGEQGRWTLLAQSYGGFVSMRYLSVAPHAIEVALFAGALPPIGVSVTDVYRATYRRLLERNRRYYERYPMDVRRVHEIVEFLRQEPVTLPDGGLLTPRRFLQLGLRLGTSAGFETLHFMLESSFLPPHCIYLSQPLPQPQQTHSGDQETSTGICGVSPNGVVAAVSSEPCVLNIGALDPTSEGASGSCSREDTPGNNSGGLPHLSDLHIGGGSSSSTAVPGPPGPLVPQSPLAHMPKRLSPNFLHAVVNWQPFELQPLYTVLQEAIYMGDGAHTSSKWAADRVLKEFPEFTLWQHSSDMSVPVYFTGEMIYPWMFEGDYRCLVPLKDAAYLLAEKMDWPILYDLNALRSCKVPCAAAVYYEDMYVESGFSEDTGRMLPQCKMWITNEYQHSGLQDDGYNIMAKLLNMVRGGLQIPS